jgi:hypothetical protein
LFGLLSQEITSERVASIDDVLAVIKKGVPVGPQEKMDQSAHERVAPWAS